MMYLISNDTDMLEELSKLAGTTHVSRTKSKSVTVQNKMFRSVVDENVSYTYSTEEERLFTVDQLMSFTNGEALVLSTVHRQDNSGRSVRPNPIHNTRETLLPMAYALHKDGHNSPFFKTAVQNMEVATSSAGMSDYILGNIPNFSKMYETRKAQSEIVESVFRDYKRKNNYEDIDIERMDKNIVSDTIMREVFTRMDNIEKEKKGELVLDEGIDEYNEEFDEVVYMEEDIDESLGEDNILSKTDEEYEKDIKDEANVYDDAHTIVQVANSRVPDSEREYKEDIERSRMKKQSETDVRNEKIYLNHTFSYIDISQGQQIISALSAALDSADISADDLSALYKWSQSKDRYSIVYVPTNREIAVMSEEDTIEAVNDAWVVTDYFTELLRDVAMPTKIDVTALDTNQIKEEYLVHVPEVEKLFEIDTHGIVSREFVSKFNDLIEKS